MNRRIENLKDLLSMFESYTDNDKCEDRTYTEENRERNRAEGMYWLIKRGNYPLNYKKPQLMMAITYSEKQKNYIVVLYNENDGIKWFNLRANIYERLIREIEKSEKKGE